MQGLSASISSLTRKIREGMTVVTPIKDDLSRALILAIFTSCGRCRFLDEKYFDTCTALAGSGPAFVALVLEAMADGGVMMGLPRAEALELAAQSESMAKPGKANVSHAGNWTDGSADRSASCAAQGQCH
jgi:pyrroline-5-carboxylate reductase